VTRCHRAGVPGCFATARVLECVHLRVAAGEAVGLVGREGAGKTTLLLCAAGLMHPDGGAVRWLGRAPRPLDGAPPPASFVPTCLDGEMRLAAVTRAIAQRIPILLLDSPLDRSQAVSAEAIADYVRRGGAALLAAREAADLAGVATRVATLRDGRLTWWRDEEAVRTDEQPRIHRVAERVARRALGEEATDDRRPILVPRRSVDSPPRGR
jgi:ABC-type cobalamin/Fe3+-siderophores transport system ATPase subunit